jgi:hypothetical protein
MIEASDYWITVVQLGTFDRAIEGLLTQEEVTGLIAFLAQHPDDGVVLSDTGGIRKLRWGARGKGKSGGARIIYYFRDLNMPLYLLTGFGKGDKINLTKSEKMQLRKTVDALVGQQWTEKVMPRVERINRS